MISVEFLKNDNDEYNYTASIVLKIRTIKVYSMQAVLIIATTLFSLFTTMVMSYISMATPIGPWMEATVVLLATLIFKGIFRIAPTKQMATIGIVTAAGSLGGIIATACAFSFPTLFFLDKDLFDAWLAQPLYFATILGALVAVAGSVAFLIVNFFEKRLLEEPNMPFPIGTMVYKMIAAQNQMRKSLELVAGAISALCITGVQYIVRSIPNKITLLASAGGGVFRIPPVFVQFDTLPMLWAIGFVTGHVIALPLLVGMISKIILVDPLQLFFFPTMTNGNFVLAFCSGMVLQGALLSFMDLPATVYKTGKRLYARFFDSSATLNIPRPLSVSKGFLGAVPLVFLIITSVIIVSFLSWFNFSLFSQLYLIIVTCVCAYQLLIIAGKAGIAPLGRFATFVMVPGLIIFGYNAVQVTIVATFVELCGGIAVDVMFGRKMAKLAAIERARVQKYQWLGLLVSACSIGFIFWVLITHFGLGTTQLFAQRAQSRALLINAYSFNWIVVLFGVLFSFALKYIKVNAVLVLGGLLMPFDYSLPLILGGLSTYLVKDKEAQYPFWSGVFAASSIMMILRTLL